MGVLSSFYARQDHLPQYELHPYPYAEVTAVGHTKTRRGNKGTTSRETTRASFPGHQLASNRVVRSCFASHPMVCEAVEAVTELPTPLAEKYAPYPMGPGIVSGELSDGHGDGVFGENFKGLFKTKDSKPKYFAIWDYPKPAKDVMKSLEQLKLSREALDIALGVKKPPGKSKKRPLATGPERQVSNSGRGGGGAVGGSVARNQKKVVDSSVEKGPSTSGVVGKASQKKKKQNSYTKLDAALDLGFLMT